MENLLKPYSAREMITCGLMLLVIGGGMLVFSRVSDNSRGRGKGKIAGDRAMRARSSAYFILFLGIVMGIFGVCTKLGVFGG